MSVQADATAPPPRSARRPRRPAPTTDATSVAPVLCIDLDGTLLRGDLLYEGLAQVLATNPFRLPRVLAWLAKGRRAFKERLATSAELDVAVLPYREEVVELARQARAAGRRVLLVTAAADSLATRVADHLGIFDEVIASGLARGNLAGQRKADYLVERFGRSGYEYVGDSRNDLPVWGSAATGIAVDVPGGLRRRLAAGPTPMRFLESIRPTAAIWLRQLRLHQMSKNVLVFLPLLLAHQFFNWDALGRALVMFAAFCLLSAGTYVFNDLHDLDKDRHHPTKRQRPLASGRISIPVAAAASIGLVLAGLGVAFLLGPTAGLILLGYLVLTLSYSLVLRSMIVGDVLALAGLYTVRIFAGAIAIGVAVSIWVALTSIFLFFSLALMKRVAELVNHDRESSGGRSYLRHDRTAVLSAGISSGMVAILVVAMYIDSDVAKATYSTPELLWAIIPLLLFWLTRMWLVTDRGQMHDDPVAYAMRDHTSQVVVVVGAAIVVAANLVGG